MEQLDNNSKVSLKRPSSRYRKSTQRWQFFDLSQNQDVFASKLKLDLMTLQEQIDQFQDQNASKMLNLSEYQSSNQRVLRKWIATIQCGRDLGSEIDQRINAGIDSAALLQQLDVPDINSAASKLYSCFQLVELLLSKLTHLEMLHHLHYDDQFMQLTDTKPFKSNIQFGVEYNPSSFAINQINLERLTFLFNHFSKNRQAITTKEAQQSDVGQSQINSRVSELLTENDQLRQSLNKMTKELALIESQRKDEAATTFERTNIKNAEKIAEDPQFKQVSDKAETPSDNFDLGQEQGMISSYAHQELQEETAKLKQKIVNLEVSLQKATNEMQQYQEFYLSSQQENSKLRAQILNNGSGKQIDLKHYATSLLLESERMQNAFKKKFIEQQNQIDQILTEKGTKYIMLESELKSEKEKTSRLLKKLSVYM